LWAVKLIWRSNEYLTLVCGECHIVGLHNTEPLPNYYENEGLGRTCFVQFGHMLKWKFIINLIL
jgi:hypothetical protein